MSPLSPSNRFSLLAALGVWGALLGCSSPSSAVGGQDAGRPDVHADTGTDAASAGDTAGGGQDAGPPDVQSDTGTDAASAGDTGGDDGSVEGKPCASQADCSSSTVCAYPTAQGCNAMGVCISNGFIGGCECPWPPQYVCDCTGNAQLASCCYPQGYAPFPISPSTSCLPDAGSDGAAEAGTDAAAD